MNATEFTRNRIVYALIILIVVILGLASRRYSENLPEFIATYAGDTLWTLMIFLLIGFLFPSQSTLKVAAIALLFSFCIELSQLYHAPWIDEIRQNRLAALVLGRGFLWSDLLCYSVGVAIGAMAELFWKKL
jgi:glycopeptide antibiotics resistance protein